MRSRSRHARRSPVAVWLAVALCVAVIAVAAWRWAPRPATPPTETMKAASESITAAAIKQSAPPKAPTNPKTDRGRLMQAAFAMQGIPYKWGAKGPDTYDCSGFTKAAYAKIGTKLPDGSFNQADGEQPLDEPAALVAGDLLFYRWSGSDRITHVTMYAGDGWVIGTGSPGQPKEVVVYPLSDDLRDDGRVITFRHIRLEDE